MQLFANRLEEKFKNYSGKGKFPGGIYPRKFLLVLRDVLMKNSEKIEEWALFMKCQKGNAVKALRLAFFNAVRRVYLTNRKAFDEKCRGGSYLEPPKLCNYSRTVFKPMEENPPIRQTMQAYIAVIFGKYFNGFSCSVRFLQVHGLLCFLNS